MKSFEASNAENLMTFFDNLRNIINDYRIGASECWNEDECGIRLGCLRERVQVLVVRTTRSQRPEVLDPSNRESSTLIGTVNAAGESIPPWLIFKTFPTEAWAEVMLIIRFILLGQRRAFQIPRSRWNGFITSICGPG